MKYPAASDGMMMLIAVYISKTIPSPVARISSLRQMKDLIFENASSMGFKSGE